MILIRVILFSFFAIVFLTIKNPSPQVLALGVIILIISLIDTYTALKGGGYGTDK